MRLELTEEQAFFKDTTRRFLESETPLSTVRALYDAPEGFDRAWWAKAAELGWTSLFVPENFGGGSLSGGPVRDAVIVAEEMGRLVAPGPFQAVNVVAAAIAWSGSDAQRAEVLPGLVSGASVAAWAHCEPGGRWRPEELTATAVIDGDAVVLNGEKAYVESAAVADHLLVSALSGEHPVQVLVPAGAPGLTVVGGRSVDITRRFGRVRLDGVRLPADAVVGEPAAARAAIGRQLLLALALQCAELVGVADRTLEFTLSYGADRFAFGRPIVSFQALKHRIADMTVWLEGSKAVSDELALAIDEGRADAGRLGSVAKAYVGEHCPDIVDDCVQMTGGIGVTWEHDIHLYSRRAVVDRALYGTPEEHKERLVALLEKEA